MKKRLLTLTLCILLISIAGCGQRQTPAPPVPTQPIEQPTTPVQIQVPGDGLDYTLTPNFGSVDLRAGFLPDPYEIAIVSGGTVGVGTLGLGTGCTGWATSAPDFRINWSGNAARLRIFFVADDPNEDATLIVNDARANWHCNDDYSGFNPLVEISNPPEGQMDVWVGSYRSGEYIAGTLYITEFSLDPDSVAVGPAPITDDGLDYTLAPNFGSVDLRAGFLPDPYEVGILSGGTVGVSALGLGSGCTGWATSAPDFRINWSGSAARLRIFFVADNAGEDATIIVNDARANWHCNDDYSGLNPLVEISNPPEGQMDVWVGSYRSGQFIAGTLYITELTLDPSDV